VVLVGGAFSDEEDDENEKKEVGRAMKMTPTKATSEQTFSTLVNGSLIKKEQAQQVSEGARKVMTVASARGR